MQFLVLSHIKPGATEEAIGAEVAAEAGQAWRYYVDGSIRQAYLRTPPDSGAVLILEADSVAQAQQLMNQMPLARAGLSTFEVMPIGSFLPWGALMTAQAPMDGPPDPRASASVSEGGRHEHHSH